MTDSYLDIRNWLPAATFAVNSHIHGTTGNTPNYLMMGYEQSTRYLHALRDLKAKPNTSLKKKSRLQTFNDASMRILHSHEKAKLYQEQLGTQISRKKGDKVPLRNHQVPNYVSEKVVAVSPEIDKLKKIRD